jgi:hypothetical protein
MVMTNICRCRLCLIDRRLTRLENAWRTEQLLAKLTPRALQHVESF